MSLPVSSPFSLEGKRVLVTGASSGIGRAIAVACSRMGSKVIITARNEKRLDETMSLLFGDGHQLVVADLTEATQRESLVEQLPKLDGIVQNAGVGSRVPCKSIEEKDICEIFNPNLIAPILLQKLLIEEKRINKGSSIVFIASMASKYPSVGNAIYSASKGAVISYAKVLGLELAPRLIRVNCICPAMVWTDLISKNGIDKEVLEEAQLKYPLKRYGTPEDIANLSVFLLSEASSWMTGSCVEINGGGEGSLI